MRRHNRYNVWLMLKTNKLQSGLKKELEKVGLLGEYETFDEFQQALLSKIRESTKKKILKYIKENPLDTPIASTEPYVWSVIARRIKVREGDLVATLRGYAFKNVPATNRYLRFRRFDTPVATYLYVNGRKLVKSMKKTFTEDQILEAIVAGEVAVIGDPKLHRLSLRLAYTKPKREGYVLLEEPPDDIKQFFIREEQRIAGKIVRKPSFEIKDSYKLAVISVR